MTKTSALNYISYKIRVGVYNETPTYLDEELFQHLDEKKLKKFIKNEVRLEKARIRSDSLESIQEYISTNWS